MLVPLPGSNSSEFGILRTFQSQEERDAFYNSPQFKEWAERAGALTEGEPEYRQLHGLEAWFRNPNQPEPPQWTIRRMLEFGIPVGAGTDATRVASYNPWVSLYWLVTGKTVGGVPMYPGKNRLSREEALRLYTRGSSWFSNESGKKGALAPGQMADFSALTEDYFAVPEDKIKGIESVLTVVDGKIVHATAEFAAHAPPPIPVLPEWSPVGMFGGYGAPSELPIAARDGIPLAEHPASHRHPHGRAPAVHDLLAGLGAVRSRYAGFWGLGCDCFAF